MVIVRSLLSVFAGVSTCGVGVCYAAEIHPLGMCVTHITLGLVLVAEGGVIALLATKRQDGPTVSGPAGE